jgi:hypothetical protein
MRALSICLIVFMAAAVTWADNKKDDGKFAPGPASSYPAKQSNGKVTVAVAAYNTEELAHTAFGKLDPNQYGVLPVLVIIQNDTDQALKLDLQAEYTGQDGRHVEATPGSEIRQLGGAERPSVPSGSPLPRLKKHKNPLDVWEIDGRVFAAKLLPPHESANGFFYFQTSYRPGAKFYLTGMKVASTGQDVLYFELPLDNSAR